MTSGRESVKDPLGSTIDQAIRLAEARHVQRLMHLREMKGLPPRKRKKTFSGQELDGATSKVRSG